MDFTLDEDLRCVDPSLNEAFNENFVQDPTAQPRSTFLFPCGICGNLPRDLVHINCRHVLCWPCCGQLQASHPGAETFPCPMCRQPFTENDIIHMDFADIFLRLHYNQYQVRCPFGCGFTDTPIRINLHQRTECPNRPVICPYPKCLAPHRFNALVDHFANMHSPERQQRDRLQAEERERRKSAERFFGQRRARIDLRVHPRRPMPTGMDSSDDESNNENTPPYYFSD